MEKNGVFSKVRSRWRSIFSKKSEVKLRDSNRLNFERFLSGPDEPLGSIVAQATVEPYTLPNGCDVLVQETTIYQEEKPPVFDPTKVAAAVARRFRRLSSGDINVIRRMTEEIDIDLKNVIFDGNEITSELDEEGVERACFKPGPENLPDKQMMFLKQCLAKVATRPPNTLYLTNGWSVDNFEALFKYMVRNSEDSARETVLSVEFRNCVVSLDYLHQFIGGYAAFRGACVQTDYVYATVHSKKAASEKKMRGAIEHFCEVESRVRQARISYASTFIVNSPQTPNVTVVVRFYCAKPCNMKKGKKSVQITIQLDQVTGHPPMSMTGAVRVGRIECECLEDPDEVPVEMPPVQTTRIVTDRQMLVDDEEVPLQLSYHIDDNDQTDCTNDSAVECDVREYVDMFPTILELFEKAGIKEIDEVPLVPAVSKFPPKKASGVTMSSDGREHETDEDTQSLSSSSSSSSSSSCSSSEESDEE